MIEIGKCYILAKEHLWRVFQNNIYFIISSNMTNSRPIAGFLVVLEPAALSAKIPFFLGQNIIGRSDSKATLVIKEPSISQKHAKLIATINKTTIIDLNSKNGTKINNEGNYIQSDNQVLIDNSMIIYFADAKCRIEMIETKQQTRNFQSITIRVENKRKQNLGQKQQKIEKEVKVQQKKVQKNEFKPTLFPSDYDLEEGFRGSQQVQQKQKNNKEQKKKSKKNTKSKPQLNTKIEQPEKSVRNTQQQQKNKKEKNSPSKNKPSQQKQSEVIKKSPKKENKEEKRKSSQALQKNVRFQEQNKQLKKAKDSQNKKAKNQQISKEKLKNANNQLDKPHKSRQDNAVIKKQINNSKEKKQSKVIQNEEKAKNKQARNRQKNDLNETLVQQQAKKRKNSEQTSLESSGNTTKKKSKMGKKLPSQSLQRELRQSAKRNIVGKRVLFSGFIPKMRRKYFILVEDYNEEFDYLVMKQYTRTFKALLAISKGILIVKYSWIQESQQSLRTLHVNNYLFSKIQPIYKAIERAKSGQKIFKGYQFYLLSEQYHLKVPQIQTLIRIVGGQTKTIKGQVKIKDPKKCIAILRNKQQNSFTQELKNQIGRAKKYGFESIYNIEFLLDACEKQQVNWQNSKL